MNEHPFTGECNVNDSNLPAGGRALSGALVTLVDERQLGGTVERFDTALPDFVMRGHRAEPLRVRFADVRKVGFFGGCAPSQPGESVTDRLVTVRIVGGESLCGLLTRSEGQRRGVHLVPADISSVARWYVPMQAIRDVIPGRAMGPGLAASEPRGKSAPQIGSGMRIGDILLDLGFVSQEQLASAVQVQRALPGKRLGEIMIEMGFTNDKTIGVALALQCDLPFVSIAAAGIDRSLRTEVPAHLARRWRALPLSRENGCLRMAVADPTRLEFKHELRARTGMLVSEAVAAAADLERSIEIFYSGSAAH
jgi:hypothetical protein